MRDDISKEVVDTIISIARKVIGNNAVDVVLRKALSNEDKEWTAVDAIFAFANEIQKLFGNSGGYATMRQLGREVAKSLMVSHPEENWQDLFETGLNLLGFAQRVESGPGYVQICDCVFYEGVLAKKGLKPVEHSVCWGGWGFIEAFAKELEGVKGIRWVERDYENKKCRFEYLT